jgi:hypothetical protein
MMGSSLAGASLGVGAPPAAAAKARSIFVARSQELPWSAAGEGVQIKPLRRDAPTSAVVKLAPGAAWRAEGVAVFVVRGAILAGGRPLGRYSYAVHEGAIQAPEGATVLTLPAAAAAGAAVDTWDLPWRFARAWEPIVPDPERAAAQPGSSATPTEPAGLVKPLAAVPNGPSTVLCAMLPVTGLGPEAPFAATADLELFLLQGAGRFGGRDLAAGGYAFMAAGDVVGPWQTDIGFVALIHLHGPATRRAARSKGRGAEAPLPVPSPWADVREG